MKRFLAIALLLATLLTLCSCGGVNGTIKQIIMEIGSSNTTAQRVYVYSFEDADVSNFREVSGNDIIPTSEGYIYTTIEYEKGDDITVWSSYYFGNDSYNGSIGTKAVVKKLVDSFDIKVVSKGDMYKVTFYDFGSYNNGKTVSERDDDRFVKKNQVMLSKEHVIIIFEP